MMDSHRKHLIFQCDDLITRIVFIMNGGLCSKCNIFVEPYPDGPGCVHHFIRKGFGGGNLKARHDIFNCVWVCPGCHTTNPDSFHKTDRADEFQWLKENFPSSYAKILETDHADTATIPTTYLEERRVELTKTLEALKGLKINAMMGNEKEEGIS